MKRLTSLGDLVSALYDTVEAGTARPASEVVTACTLTLLLRQRKREIIAALLGEPEAVLH